MSLQILASSLKDGSLTESYCSVDNIRSFNVSDDLETVYNVFDKNTGEVFNYTRVNLPLSSVDSVIYIGYKGLVYRRNFTGPVNVKWFGAVGDGVNDDSVYVQNAINSGAFELFFPDGTFRLQDIIVTNNITISGNGVKRTALRSIDGGNIIELGRSDEPVRPYIKDLKFENISSQSGVAISLRNCADFKFTGIEIVGFSIGLLSEGALCYVVDDFKISDCNIAIKLIGSRLGDSFNSPPNLVALSHGFITGCVQYSIYFDFGSALTLYHLNIDYTGIEGDVNSGGIYVGENVSTFEAYPRYSGISIKNCWFEGIKGTWLRVLSGSVLVSDVNLYDNDYPCYIDTVAEFVTFINVQGGAPNEGVLLNPLNRAAVFINSFFTNGIAAIGGGEISPYVVLINSSLIDGNNEGFGNNVRFLKGITSHGDIGLGSTSNGGKYDNAKLYLGDICFFRENGGQLRFKQGIPSSETDGHRVADVISSSLTRPSGDLVSGQQFFDRSIGKPIWYNGTDWVDSTGTIV